MDQDFMQDMLDKALGVLQDTRKDGSSFCPVIAFFKDNIGGILPMTYRNDEEKRTALRHAGKYLGLKGIHEFLFIDDTFFVMAKADDADQVEKMKFIKENWDTEKPSLYPPELRREALTMMVINFKDSTQEAMWMAEYTTSGPNLILNGVEKSPDPEVAGLIKDYILEGFLIGVASTLGKITSEEFAVHIDKEYPALQAYLKNHFNQ